MNPEAIIKEAEGEAFDIARRLRDRNFSGNKGTAIKNSTYDIGRTIVAKVGSLLFTVILARLLMPELYGLYGLALSTILMFAGFSDLGISSALVPFISKYIDKSKTKAKAYFIYISKVKVILLFIGSLLLVFSAKYFSDIYYNKPIFLALLAGAIYLPISTMSTYLGHIFSSENNFKVAFIGEVIYQLVRLTFIPILIIYIVKKIADYDVSLFYMILGLTVCFIVLGIYYIGTYFYKKPLGSSRAEKISKREKKDVWLFILPLTFTVFSGLFFGYIDTFMLGHYVDSEYIAFYQVALNLISSAATVIAFSGSAMLPLFSRFKGNKLKKSFRKARLITVIISLAAMVFTFVSAPYVIWIVYGKDYLPATIFLRVFSLWLISFPLTSLYQAYYTSQKRTKEFSIMLLISAIMNIALNYIFINMGLSHGMSEAVLGACVATIISRYLYLFGLGVYKKKIEREFTS